jgi:hypothetical protein
VGAQHEETAVILVRQKFQRGMVFERSNFVFLVQLQHIGFFQLSLGRSQKVRKTNKEWHTKMLTISLIAMKTKLEQDVDFNIITFFTFSVILGCLFSNIRFTFPFNPLDSLPSDMFSPFLSFRVCAKEKIGRQKERGRSCVACLWR